MQFNSYIFILCFLPLTLLVYFGLNHFKLERGAKVSLLFASLWFYGYFNQLYLLIICASIVVNYAISRLMYLYENKVKKSILTIGVLFNVGLIFYFKYYDFFISNVNSVFNTDFVLKNLTLPLGISFFTFQQISFMVDSFKGETKDYSFIEYALFVSFFPQLVAGPIVLHSELIPQFRDEKKWKINFDNLSRGIMMFTRGLAKKILIADLFGTAVDWGFAQAALYSSGENALSTWEAVIVMLSYTFQIYFDFSGYSDMAIGLGAMFNLKIPVNFNSPYKALSVADFWKRWHMTLTGFLTNYVYIPLGGNRKGKLRTYINTIIVFIVSGIWHGANWTFILWGIIHGLGQCFNKLFRGVHLKIVEMIDKSFIKVPLMAVLRAFEWAVTFAFLNVTWLLFRADSILLWKQILARLFVRYYFIKDELLECFRIPKIRYLLSAFGLEMSDNAVLMMSTYIVMGLALVLCLFFKNNSETVYKKNVTSLVVTAVLLMICIVSLGKVSTFLYFNF